MRKIHDAKLHVYRHILLYVHFLPCNIYLNSVLRGTLCELSASTLNFIFIWYRARFLETMFLTRDMYLNFYLQLLIIPWRIQQDIVIKVFTSSCIALNVFAWFSLNLNFFRQILLKVPIIAFHESAFSLSRVITHVRQSTYFRISENYEWWKIHKNYICVQSNDNIIDIPIGNFKFRLTLTTRKKIGRLR